jgi:hypothetical protein
MIKGAWFWGFLLSRVKGVLGGISSIPLILAQFRWTKPCPWTDHEVFLLSPKSCVKPWSESGDRELDLEELTRGLLFIPSCPGVTGLTGALNWSDRCKPFVWFSLGECPGVFPIVVCCCWSVQGRFRGVWLRFV